MANCSHLNKFLWTGVILTLIYYLKITIPQDYLDKKEISIQTKSNEQHLTPKPGLGLKIHSNRSKKIYVLINSSHGGRELRQAIRQTWARDVVHYKFLVGGEYCKIRDKFRLDKSKNYGCYFDPEKLRQLRENNTFHNVADSYDGAYTRKPTNEFEMQLLREEQEKFQDILIIEDLVDNPHNETTKMKLGLRFVIEESKQKQQNPNSDFHAKYVLLTEDSRFNLLREMELQLDNKFPYDDYPNVFLGRLRNDPGIGDLNTFPNETRYGEKSLKTGQNKYKLPKIWNQENPSDQLCNLKIPNRKNSNCKDTWENDLVADLGLNYRHSQVHRGENFPTNMNSASGIIFSLPIAKYISDNMENLTHFTNKDIALGAYLEQGQIEGKISPAIHYYNDWYDNKDHWFTAEGSQKTNCAALGKKDNEKVSIGGGWNHNEIRTCYANYLVNSDQRFSYKDFGFQHDKISQLYNFVGEKGEL